MLRKRLLIYEKKDERIRFAGDKGVLASTLGIIKLMSSSVSLADL